MPITEDALREAAYAGINAYVEKYNQENECEVDASVTDEGELCIDGGHQHGLFFVAVTSEAA